MSVGTIIRQRRQQLSVTQDVLAVKAGISKPYLSNIETGRAKNPPTDSILVALESALEFEQGHLLKLAHLERTPKDVRIEHELLGTEVQKLRQVIRELMAGPRKQNGAIDLDAMAAELRDATVGMDAAPAKQTDSYDHNRPDPDTVAAIRAGKIVPIINRVAAGYPKNFTDLDYPPGVADDYLRCPDLDDPQAFALHVEGDSMEPLYHSNDLVVFSPNTPARSGDDCFVRFEADCATTFKRFYQDDVPDGEARIRLQPLNNKYPAQVYDRQQITGLWPAVFRFEKLLRR
jgi:phage repressor protein C with HTH and peptisase S24 domain